MGRKSSQVCLNNQKLVNSTAKSLSAKLSIKNVFPRNICTSLHKILALPIAVYLFLFHFTCVALFYSLFLEVRLFPYVHSYRFSVGLKLSIGARASKSLANNQVQNIQIKYVVWLKKKRSRYKNDLTILIWNWVNWMCVRKKTSVNH